MRVAMALSRTAFECDIIRLMRFQALPRGCCRQVDQLLAVQFREDMARLTEHVGARAPGGRQTILVSATLTPNVCMPSQSCAIHACAPCSIERALQHWHDACSSCRSTCACMPDRSLVGECVHWRNELASCKLYASGGL
jgi:hypothetical protein